MPLRFHFPDTHLIRCKGDCSQNVPRFPIPLSASHVEKCVEFIRSAPMCEEEEGEEDDDDDDDEEEEEEEEEE